SVLPPFWRTWWFRLCGLITFFALTYLIYARYSYNLRKREKEKIKHMNQLLRSVREINSQLEVTRVLQKIAEESAKLIKGQPGGIGIIKVDRVVFERIWVEDHWEDCQLTFRLGEGTAGEVALSGQTKSVNEIDEKLSELI